MGLAFSIFIQAIYLDRKKPSKSMICKQSICTSTFHDVVWGNMNRRVCLGVLFSILMLCGCRSAYYSTWEKFGVYKRDLLKKRVVEARDDQKAASQQFTNALTHLKELYGFQGGNLEKTYNVLNRDYERSLDKANAVRTRITQMETVAADLFSEWEKEIKEISSANLQESSRTKLRETRARYEELHEALKRAERSMDPVLTQFHDQVLYLKHNLNAAAIGSLKGETANIQADISRLLSDM
ncbi:MAG: repair ATPase, partial [Pedosphaera sp.]|nr:repair ATPase [Pedosphaera sp.]